MTNIAILTVIWMHFVADFVCQSDWMARNKSKANIPLLTHVSVYSLPFFWFGWRYALANAGAHFVTDWITSRASSRLWAKQKVHWFFVVIGLDQAIHMSTLVLTLPIFLVS